MAVTAEQLEAFQHFAREKINGGADDLSFDELVELWMLQNLPDRELQDSLRALEEGIADAQAGRVRPAEEVFDDLAARYSGDSNP